MIFHETGLVVLYFFTWAEIEKQVATAKPDAIGQWCQFLTGQLQLEPVPGQRQMWRHPWHTYQPGRTTRFNQCYGAFSAPSDYPGSQPPLGASVRLYLFCSRDYFQADAGGLFWL